MALFGMSSLVSESMSSAAVLNWGREASGQPKTTMAPMNRVGTSPAFGK